MPTWVAVASGVLILTTPFLVKKRRKRAARERRRQEEFLQRQIERMEAEDNDREKRYPATHALANFMRATADLDYAYERALALAAVKLELREKTDKLNIVFVAIHGITRMVALSRDSLREQDADILNAFIRMVPYSRFLSDLSGDVMTKLLQEVNVDQDEIAYPVTLLTLIDSPEAQVLHDLLIAYADEVSRSPPDAYLKRRLGVEWVRGILSTALPSWGPASDHAGGVKQDLPGYELFDLQPTCTDAELRAAYLEKIKSWHPDVLNNIPEELKQIATVRVQLFNEVYSLLKTSRSECG